MRGLYLTGNDSQIPKVPSHDGLVVVRDEERQLVHVCSSLPRVVFHEQADAGCNAQSHFQGSIVQLHNKVTRNNFVKQTYFLQIGHEASSSWHYRFQCCINILDYMYWWLWFQSSEVLTFHFWLRALQPDLQWELDTIIEYFWDDWWIFSCRFFELTTRTIPTSNF